MEFLFLRKKNFIKISQNFSNIYFSLLTNHNKTLTTAITE